MSIELNGRDYCSDDSVIIDYTFLPEGTELSGEEQDMSYCEILAYHDICEE